MCCRANSLGHLLDPEQVGLHVGGEPFVDAFNLRTKVCLQVVGLQAQQLQLNGNLPEEGANDCCWFEFDDLTAAQFVPDVGVKDEVEGAGLKPHLFRVALSQQPCTVKRCFLERADEVETVAFAVGGVLKTGKAQLRHIFGIIVYRSIHLL